MEIIQPNSDRLILKQDYKKEALNDFIIIMAILTPFFIAPLSILSPLVRQNTLNCTRFATNQVNCQVENKIINIPIYQKQLVQVTAAEVSKKIEKRDNEEYEVYQIELYFQNGKQDFGDASGMQKDIQELAKQINSFLANSNQLNFKTTQSELNKISFIEITVIILFFSVWYGGLSIFPIRFIFDASYQVYDFNRKINQLLVIKKYHFLPNRETKYSLLDTLRLKMSLRSDSEGYIRYKVKLFVNNKKILLYNNCNQNDAEQVVNTIADFLNINPENN
jgi:hypothetical protein